MSRQTKINERANEIFRDKTIRALEATSANVWTFFFTDDTKAEIEVECFHSCGIYGMIPRVPEEVLEGQGAGAP